MNPFFNHPFAALTGGLPHTIPIISVAAPLRQVDIEKKGIGTAGNLAMVAYRGGASRKASKPLRVRSSQPPVSEMTETERKKVQVASASR